MYKVLLLPELMFNPLGYVIKLLDVSEMVKYENGKRTDIVEALKYSVILLGGAYEKFDIIINSLNSPFYNSDINFNEQEIFVEFTSLKGTARGKAISPTYAEIQVNWTADEIIQIEEIEGF